MWNKVVMANEKVTRINASTTQLAFFISQAAYLKQENTQLYIVIALKSDLHIKPIFHY